MAKRLDELTYEELAAVAGGSAYPKWVSMGHLRLLGLPTLDGICIDSHDLTLIERVAEDFADAHCTDYLQVRSDRRREDREYYRGGNNFTVVDAVAEIRRLFQLGRAAIILEPTNRFTNLLNVGISLEIGGRMVIEVLGPGYDVGDLSRGGVTPPVSWLVENIDWRRYERPWAWDFRATRRENPAQIEERRGLRLQQIERHLLHLHGLRCSGTSFSAADWLKQNQFCGLWSGSRLNVEREWLIYWYDCAFMVAAAHFLRPGYSPAYVLSGSLLEDGRFVFWDVVDGRRKYALPSST